MSIGTPGADSSGSAPAVAPTATRETATATDMSDGKRTRQVSIAIPPALLFLPFGALAVYWAKSEMLSLERSRREPSAARIEAAPGAAGTPAITGRAEAARERQHQKQQQAEELARARERVNVTVYYAQWCPACRTTRAYLRERGIAAEEHDIDKDSRARSRQRLLNPRGSIPTIDIEGQVLVGFDASKIERAIDRAAQARLERNR